ncbi:MAG: synthase subunit [Firmicutes bacterium]|nr:synthase subunit [Bacillota bacterium]
MLFGLAADSFHLHEPVTWINLPYIPISNLIVAEWVVMAILIVVAIIVNKAVLGGKFTKLRGTLELLMDFLEGWYSSFIGSRKQARKYLPLLGTLFLFILISNYMGIIPTIGYEHSLFAPTGQWGTTLGLALVVAIAVQYISVKEMGVGGWLKHLVHLGPLSVLEEFVRPFSLSLRLFGNIFAEEILLAVIVMLAPYFAPIPIMGLSLMFGAIQAVVFTTLSAIYIGGVLEHAAHAHGKHGHNEAAHAH